MELVEITHKNCKVWVVSSQPIYSELLVSYLSMLTAKTHGLIVSKSKDFCLFMKLWVWWAFGVFFLVVVVVIPNPLNLLGNAIGAVGA